MNLKQLMVDEAQAFLQYASVLQDQGEDERADALRVKAEKLMSDVQLM